MSRSWRAGLSPDVGVVIPAGGRGDRAGPGGLKQFRPVGGEPLLLRTVRPFACHPRVTEIIVALPAAALKELPGWLAPVLSSRLRVVAGGDTRARSVWAGVRKLTPASRIVLVHDAVRPFVSSGTIDAVIARAGEGVGAVAAIPLADTLKRVESDGRVVDTVDRRGLWRAQTPQGFPRDMLESAYRGLAAEDARWDATDDAMIIQAAGFPVTVVPDSERNMKVTTAEDFALADAIAAG